MAYFETALGLTIKEILEIVIVIISLILFYLSYRVYCQLKNGKSRFTSSLKLIMFGFGFFMLSMVFELIDSFYLDWLFDNLQLLTGAIGFIILLVGFREGFHIIKK